MIRVLVADDHAVVREGLVALLRSAADMECVATAEDGPSPCSWSTGTGPTSC